MSRFQPLFEHFQQHVAGHLPMLQAEYPELSLEKLVYAYREGVYSIYEKTEARDHTWGPKITEINPAHSLTSLREVWFFQGGEELEAFVEYQPEYRPDLRVVDLHVPLLQLRVKQKPAISGFN